MEEYFKNKIEKEDKDKSKVQNLLDGQAEWKPGKRLEYRNKLTRNQVSIVFQAMTRMIKVRGNYKKDKGISSAEYAEQRYKHSSTY